MSRLRAAALVAAVVVAAFALVACLAGCGRKTPLVPPHVPAAARPQILAFRALGNDLELTWRYPAAAIPPEEFRVLRADLSAGCPDCPPMYSVLATVPAQAQGDYFFRDTGLIPGAGYAYEVLPVFPRAVEGEPSPQLKLMWRSAAPPTGISAVAQPDVVRLFWEPELGALSYAVWRAEGRDELKRVAEAPGPPYVDRAVVAGHTYRYAVATIGDTGEGPPSEPVEAFVPTP